MASIDLTQPDGGLKGCLRAANVDDKAIEWMMGKGADQLHLEFLSDFMGVFSVLGYEKDIADEVKDSRLFHDDRSFQRLQIGRIRQAHVLGRKAV